MKVTKKQLAEFMTQAEAGDLGSQIKVADIYCYGWGVSEDKQKAIFWYKKAIDQGSVDALVNSEFCFTETLGYEAVEYYRPLAKKGNIEAQLILASLYAEGKCVPKNDAEAFRLRLHAAELNNGQACHIVGSALVIGDGVKKDIQEGIKWLLKVAHPRTTTSDFDMSGAQLMLAEAYSDPENPNRNMAEAYTWLNLLLGYCLKDDNFRQGLIEKREGYASSMTQEEIEEAQRRSAELFVPDNLIQERIRNESSGLVQK